MNKYLSVLLTNLFLLDAANAADEAALAVAREAALAGAGQTLLLGVIGYGMFRAITVGVPVSSERTPLQHGRWVGGVFAGFSMLAPVKSAGSSLGAMLGTGVALALFWLLIGFVAGYIWRVVKTGKSINLNHFKKNAEVQNPEHFAQALREIKGQNQNEATWAIALAHSNGDVAKAESAYIKARASELSKSVNESELGSLENVVSTNAFHKNQTQRWVLVASAIVVSVGGYMVFETSMFSTTTKTKLATCTGSYEDVFAARSIKVNKQKKSIAVTYQALVDMDTVKKGELFFDDDVYSENSCVIFDDNTFSCARIISTSPNREYVTIHRFDGKSFQYGSGEASRAIKPMTMNCSVQK